jgi:CheY-like chemotaxis protein
LTLVRRIVELHGGRISVTSEGLGKGSAFSVLLPRIDAPILREAAAKTGSQGQARKVLVIEDAEDARKSLRKILEFDGHEVQTETDGASGLAALIQLRPDIALIDIGLPTLDGYEVARRARAAGVRSRLVALTGYGLPDDKAKAMDAGFDAHLTKPTSVDRLLSIVSETPHAAGGLNTMDAKPARANQQ